MLKVKPGVEFAFHPAGFRILEVLKVVSRGMGRDLTITSGSDGVHSGPTDPHKSGEAYDIRSKDLNTPQKLEFLTRVKALLGDRFFCFLENPGDVNEHFHLQRRNSTTYTIFTYLQEPYEV